MPVIEVFATKGRTFHRWGGWSQAINRSSTAMADFDLGQKKLCHAIDCFSQSSMITLFGAGQNTEVGFFFLI
jgi:hypothetical protein